MNMEFVYIGFSESMLIKMLDSNQLRLCGVITRNNKLSPKILDKLRIEKISIWFVENKEELRNVIKLIGDKLYVMYVFNIIIPSDVANEYMIINIHSGDLMTNRGKNPVSWTILLGEEKVVVSIHKINGEIDKGLLISSYDIPISDDDDYITLHEKICSCWIKYEKVILDFIQGKIKGKVICNGKYRRSIEEKDYTIDILNDSPFQIIRKIKSQRGYRGAVINHNGMKLYVTDWEKLDDDNLLKNSQITDKYTNKMFESDCGGAEEQVVRK